MKIAGLFRGKIKRVLREALSVLLIAISTLSFSQEIIQINAVREGYYKIFDADSTQIDQKATELEAMQGLTNYQFRSGRVGYYIPPNFRVDIKGNVTVEQIKTDTLVIYGAWHIRGENGDYFRLLNYGDILKIEADTILFWQNDIEVIRTKTFGETHLKLTNNIPFQFISDTITRTPGETTYRWQTFATKTHCIKTYVNGVYTGDEDISCSPGNIIYQGYKLYRHTNRLTGLEPKTTYNILVEGTDDLGAFNIIKFNITTL